MTLRDHLGPRTPENAAESDDRVRLMLLGQASKRGALDWRYDDVEPVVARLLQEIDTLRAALEAAPAAVLMEAASIARECVFQYADPVPPIRALATTDSTAALKRVIDKALRMAKKVGDVVEHTDRPNWASEGAWAHCAETYTMRIAAITADDVLRDLGGRG